MTKEYEKTHPWLTFSVDLRRAPPSFWATLGECQSKCEHLAGVPLRPDIAEKLHGVYLAKGIWGTTAIEGNTLSEEEVHKHVQGKLEVPPNKEYLKQEIDNILQESNRMLAAISSGNRLSLSPDRIKEINGMVLRGLTLEEGVIPAQIRTYPVGVLTYRGAPAEDCEYLLERLCSWLNSADFEPQMGLGQLHMAILKAMIAHLYIEWIHPFGDGNGRTGRLVEVQILLATGVPSPAGHLLSNHYNLSRNQYLSQLKAASESGGEVVPFLSYALDGFLEGLKGQLAYIRKLQMEVAWINYVHDYFRHNNTRAANRQKALLLDVFAKEEPVPISEIDQLSPKLAKAYAGMHPRTAMRDVEALEKAGLIAREGKKIRANQALIARFLPICVRGGTNADKG
jgi:Fic family protein